VQSADAAFAQARDLERAAAARDEAARQALNGAYQEVDRARQALAAAQSKASQLDGRLAALIEAASATDNGLAESEQAHGDASSERTNLPDLGQARSRQSELKTELAEKRSHLIECRAADDRLRREKDARVRRQQAGGLDLAAEPAQRLLVEDRDQAARHLFIDDQTHRIGSDVDDRDAGCALARPLHRDDPL